MLSRVADSLYWMSRYFERAGHCARVLEATWNLMLNSSKLSTDQRWYRALSGMGLKSEGDEIDPQAAMLQLTIDRSNPSSIVSCITAARENASQVREEISSEMWEMLNRQFHRITQMQVRGGFDATALDLLTTVREGSYTLEGITNSTINHGDGWQFLQLGKYSERACGVSALLDAYFTPKTPATDLDWIGLLTSCAAFEAYTRAYTADLRPDCVAEFVLLHREFPYSVRYAVERMDAALTTIVKRSVGRNSISLERIIGRLRASLAYLQISEVMAGDVHKFLNGVIDQCRNLHGELHSVYIDYPIEVAFDY